MIDWLNDWLNEWKKEWSVTFSAPVECDSYNDTAYIMQVWIKALVSPFELCRVILCWMFFLDTDSIHPADVGRGAGEDGGPLGGVATRGRHKAGHTVDNPLAVDTAVQRATGVTLEGEKPHHLQNYSIKKQLVLSDKTPSQRLFMP